MSEPRASRTNINDGPIAFNDYISLNRAGLEAFFRSMLKPVNDNDSDSNGKNFIVEENFSLEPLKRLYFQDFYKSLLSTEKLYDLVKYDKFDNEWGNKKVLSNSVKIKGNTDNTTLNTAIDAVMGRMNEVEIDESHFHSTIEFTEGNRNKGLYDYGKLPTVNASGEMFQLGLLEQVFKEEEALLLEDIRRENRVISYQTIARRLTELFARLSNIRLSMLFWTDKVNNYAKQWSVAALDIFYNLLSRMSEARRLNVKLTENVPVVDILFWIDHTGSMIDVIGDVQQTVKNMAISFASTTVRVGFTMHSPGRSTPLAVSTKRPSYISKDLATRLNAWSDKSADKINVWPVLSFTNDYSEIVNFFGGRIVAKTYNGKTKLYGLPPGGAVSWGGNEYVEGLQATVRGEYVKGNGSRARITEDVDVVWSDIPGSYRKVILISDEPNDNYINISRQFPLAYHSDSSKRIKLKENPYAFYGSAYKVDSNGKLNMITRRSYKIIPREDKPGWYTWEPLWEGVRGQVKIGNKWYYYKDAEFVVSSSTGPWTNTKNSGYANAESTCSVKFTYYTQTTGKVSDIVKGDTNTTTISDIYFHRSSPDAGAYEQQEKYFKTNWHLGSTGHYEPKTMVLTAGYTHRIEALNPVRITCDVWGFDMSLLRTNPSVINWKYVNAKPHDVDNSCIDHCPNHWDCCYFSTSGFNYSEYKIPNKSGGVSNPKTTSPENIDSFVQAFTSTHTDLYWMYWKSSELNDFQEFFRETAKYRIKEDIIKKINGHGAHAEFTELRQVDAVVEQVKKILLEAVLASAKYYARAARLNKTYADLMRPCVFVPNLVSAMMMISQSKAVKDGTAPSGTQAPPWTTTDRKGLLDKVIDESSGNFKWFGRTNEPMKNSGGNIIVLQEGMYGSINDAQNEALGWGGDYVESLTGIHLKLIDKPTGDGWSSGTSWTDNDVKTALTKGFEILADAFTECLNDAETMKVLDMTTNPPTPTNFPELLKQRGDKKPTESGALANIGDLQCSLVLERIIAKVYQALNVSGCSYFIGKVPKLNMDFALRFLTDQTISDKNELTAYRKTYSDVVEYAKRASAWNSGRNKFDADTVYTLDNVVTKTISGTRVLNPSFAYLREDWSLCPYRFNRDKGRGTPSGIVETSVGRDNDYGVAYSEIAPTCPFAETVVPEAGQEGDPPCDRPHGCSLHTFYEVSSESEKDALLAKLNGVPSVCPCVALVNGIRTQLNESPERIPYENGSQYIHALFKNIQNGKPADTRQEEEKSMGYKSSASIYEHITYPGEVPPSPDEMPPTYKDEVHSSVRLVYIDHLIRLCQDLFMVNMDIAFEEPYLKTKVEQAERHYYGTADYGSFEPVSCYRFSNFHALNDKDERSAAAGTYRLKYFARTVGNQWVTAVNRDLSGETSRSNSIWSRSETLDNERKVPGTTKLESKACYPYYFSYANQGSYPYMGSSDEIRSGVIDPSKTRSMDICRSNHTHPFYQIHMMDELASVVSDSNKATSLSTFEVYVKRFRPIFLPNANDLFVSYDRDPLNPSDNNKSLPVNGWSLTPHKYSADAHFSKDAIIIPTNFGSRNSPRSDWFHELDYAYHKAVFQDSGKKTALCGFYDESLDSTVNIDNVNIVGKELEDFAKYRSRDWMYPASLIAHCHTSGDNGALATITTAVQEIINADTNPADGANDWTQGAKDNIVVTKEGNQTKLYVSKSNLNRFDLFKCIDSRVNQTTALNANWLYITTHGAGGGVEASQCMYPLPWVFFHSSRGSTGAGPDNYYHGLGNRVTTNHETSFNDGTTNGMRFFAVDAVLSQNPVKMKLFGRSDTEVNAKANIFSKGFYDPSCCGTKETWHTHGKAYYGWENGSSNKDGPRPDKYYLPYDSNGRNHVTGGTSLTSSVASGQYYSYISGSVKTAPFADKNDTIVRTLKGKPMTWSLWNVIRHSLYWCYNVRDLDYDPNRIGCTVDRKTMGASNEEIEFKTGQSIRAMYKEWYHRFTYNGYYTQDSRSGCSASTAWPYKVNQGDPSDYGHAQKLMNGTGTSIAGGPCKIEWTNLVADMSIIYNEVSDTHNSCLTMYTGGHPNYSSGYTDSASQEFRGPHGGNDSGIWVSERSSIPSSWALTGAVPNSSNSVPFRYALQGIDMCRNFMALTYRGYNSPIPDKAYGGGGVPKFQPHSTHPKELRVSREIQTINYGGNPPTILTRSTYSTDGTEFTNNEVLLRDIYPPSEQNDTEGCDSNFLQRLLLPIYPNWEDLHDSNGVPLYPDSVSDDDMKKIVFCVAPITYYNGLADGNDDGAQMGERMMAFCITQFFMGEDAEKMTSVLDTEFFSGIAYPNVSVVAPTLGHDYKPGDPAWGQGLVTAGNWKPEKWNRQS